MQKRVPKRYNNTEDKNMPTLPRYFSFPFFNDVEPLWGPRLWPILNQPDNIQRMILATTAGLTAAEALTSQLLDVIVEDLKFNRVKRFTGWLIRNVMEQHGYQVDRDRQDVRCKDRRLFHFASAYKPIE